MYFLIPLEGIGGHAIFLGVLREVLNKRGKNRFKVFESIRHFVQRAESPLRTIIDTGKVKGKRDELSLGTCMFFYFEYLDREDRQ